MARLDPYVAGEQPKDKRYIKLNTNENPFPPSPLVVERLSDADLAALRLYPDPDSKSLVRAIANHYKVPETNVFVGNGSDEVLGLAFMAFFKQAKPLYFPEVTYSFYPSYCRLFDIQHTTFPLTEDWQITFDTLEGTPGGIIFPNPNAPTGRLLPLATIEALLQRFPEVVVVVDEAYIDFGGETAAPLTQRYANVLVVQTLSKSRSLAGMRVGFAIGNEELIEGLQRVKNSFNAYPLDQLATTAAVAAFEDQAYFEQCCSAIINSREWLTEQFLGLGFEVIPSYANFIFARHREQDAAAIAQGLRDRGILVRHFKRAKIDGFLRITIGSQADMQTLVEAMALVLKTTSE